MSGLAISLSEQGTQEYQRRHDCDVTTAVFAKLKPPRDSLSAGYRIEMQGAVEESAKSQTSINEKMPAMLLVILLLLMVQLQLQHFGKTLMVVATGPLGATRRRINPA